MGRYSVPQQFDHGHDDDGLAEPMDWTLIPDDEPDEGPIGAGNSSCCHYDGRGNNDDSRGNDERRSVVCYDDTTAPGTNNQENDVGRGEEGGCDHVLGETTDVNNANNNHQTILQVAEQYLEQSNHYYLAQQQLSEKRRRRIRTVMVIVVALIAVVLKRHAPPPPPLLNQSSLAEALIPTDSVGSMSYTDADSISSVDSSIDDSNPRIRWIVVQHETWFSYLQHLLYLIHRAIEYGVSVAWYAVSNAFRYASEEVKDGLMTCLHGNGGNAEDSLCVVWKKNLISIATTYWRSQWQSDNNMHHDSQSMNVGSEESELKKVSVCPIRLPAASNRHTHLPRGAISRDNDDAGTESTMMEGWSTEDFLRQTIGASLSAQNLALKVIAEGLNTWGDSLVEAAPVALVHKMANAVSVSPRDRFLDEETLSSWILPPAIGFLLVGPEGVGKLHTARRVAHLLSGHCSEKLNAAAASEPSGVGGVAEGVLEIIAGDFDGYGNNREMHPAKELIVNHILRRNGLGSVIIIHHIELLPISILSEISQILSGKSDKLSHQSSENLVEASCNGAVFVITSKQWGSKSIFQHIQRNGGLMNGLGRESLISSIRWEVDSHLDYWTKLASHTTVAPFFPFQQEDVASILQSRVQTLNMKYHGLHWNRLEVSHATIKHSVGVDHVEYLDLYNSNHGSGEEESNMPLLTFSTSGAHALDNNALWQTLRNRLIAGTRRRPGLTLKVNLDDKNKETVFSWCSIEKGGLESCEVEWRSLLT
ncbi:hypothetical protein ACHAXR_006316 [Thalassiosira sp. AJA248-18]